VRQKKALCVFQQKQIVEEYMGKSYMPEAQGDFLEWAKNFLSVAGMNKTAWNLPDANLAALGVKLAAWEPLYVKCQGSERTPNDVALKNTGFEELQKMFRGFVNEFVRYNSTMTDDNRRALGCHVPSPRTPVPPPSTVPESEARTPYPMVVEIHFRDKGSSRRGKPKGVQGAKFAGGILDHPPASIADLTMSRFDPASPFVLNFEENQRGKTLYYALRWENAKGEGGTWSPTEKVIIP
jgi:hypothetical protein